MNPRPAPPNLHPPQMVRLSAEWRFRPVARTLTFAAVLLLAWMPTLGGFCADQDKGVPAPAMPGKNVPAVKVDTVGYPPFWRKIAIFNVEPKGAAVKDENGRVVYSFQRGDLYQFGRDEASKDPVWQADFSGLTLPGRYRVECKGALSDWFEVREGLYREALDASLKHFYFQRCRTALKEPHAQWGGDAYTRNAACHEHANVGWDLESYPEKKKRFKLSAGWHDAGNTDMYVPSTAPTCQALMTAYERDPGRFQDGDLDIPESGNGIPDILDEAGWGLTWVLSMQGKDGGVRMRDAVVQWTPEGPADADHLDRWVAGVGTASTAKACAAYAQAARVYRKLDPAFSVRCESAALAAWKYLVSHPKRILVDGHGSPQPLWDDGAEYAKEVGSRLVAAAEIYRTFRFQPAMDSFLKLIQDEDATPERALTGAWTNLSRWAFERIAEDGAAPAEAREASKEKLLAMADLLREQAETRDGYRCATKPRDYYWGHNSNLMEKAEILLASSRLDPEGHAWAKEAARDQWHWILGRNPDGYSMVTRVGKGPPVLYHMEWGKKDRPPPGYLVGGPNDHDARFLSPDAPAKALLWDNPAPLRSGLAPHSLWHAVQSDLWDGGFVAENQWTTGWWTVTEPDIYYNANLVLVAALMQD